MQEASESIFSLGNGRMGQRANFEEQYSGETLQGTYLAGVYYPDKTRVGWWKNGYPEYFAKVLNAPNWIGIDVEIDGQQLDLHKCEPVDFRRELNMQAGLPGTDVYNCKRRKEAAHLSQAFPEHETGRDRCHPLCHQVRRFFGKNFLYPVY